MPWPFSDSLDHLVRFIVVPPDHMCCLRGGYIPSLSFSGSTLWWVSPNCVLLHYSGMCPPSRTKIIDVVFEVCKRLWLVASWPTM